MATSVLCDMDGVLYRGRALIKGAQEFVDRLLQERIPFLFLTNNSEQTSLDLQRKLEQLGIRGVTEDNFITSAMATAMFLKHQNQGSTAYVVGGGGLASELYKVGFSISEHRPDYVVVGKTTSLNFDMLRTAVRLISQGAKFIGTNPDVLDPTPDGIEPACGSILAAIERASDRKPYIVGKPNPLMMTIATRKLRVHAEDTLMIGDRMDTDIIAGLEAGMKTGLVLSGVTSRDMLEKFPYRPNHIFNHIGEINPREL
ncbi:MAG TPA: HAD-IIA family hydrolase [Clostridia bacterium]|nr:HAD-IIA family hydrolase [Clostridia bacterium]